VLSDAKRQNRGCEFCHYRTGLVESTARSGSKMVSGLIAFRAVLMALRSDAERREILEGMAKCGDPLLTVLAKSTLGAMNSAG
jgi:hypothetical protein